MKKRWFWTTLSSIIFLSFLVIAAMFYAPLGAQGILWIEKGESTGQIATKMRRCNLPAYWGNVWLYKKLSGKALRNGEYQLQEGWTLWQACSHVASGQVIMHKLTIPEGWTAHQIVNKVRAEPLLVGDAPQVPEGSLLPETYHFARGDGRKQLLQQMEQAMKQWLHQAWEERDSSVTLTPEQVVTLASIIECETPLDAEKPVIAGVFYNRLSQNMLLQSDPTVAYAITQGQKELEKPLTYNDLRIVSPFNTYAVSGLPPHPIACPGKAALQAVLRPNKHAYLYFVADGQGGHAMSETFTEHTRNVQKWRQVQATHKKQKSAP